MHLLTTNDNILKMRTLLDKDASEQVVSRLEAL